MSVCVCLRTNLKIHGKASKVDQSLYSVRQPISRLSDKLEALGSIQTLAVISCWTVMSKHTLNLCCWLGIMPNWINSQIKLVEVLMIDRWQPERSQANTTSFSRFRIYFRSQGVLQCWDTYLAIRLWKCRLSQIFLLITCRVLDNSKMMELLVILLKVHTLFILSCLLIFACLSTLFCSIK